MRSLRNTVFAMLWIVAAAALAEAPLVDQAGKSTAVFRDHAGVELVFEESELPEGVYHDLMVPLAPGRRAAAIRICEAEARKFPRHFLRDSGMKAIGVFASCASRHGDGFRTYDAELKGYRYYGIYNGRDAVAAAYYSDEQLPLTFQHEVFHHIDRLTGPAEEDDRRLAEVLAGKKPYPVPAISEATLASLKKLSSGRVLRGAVSEYAEKNPAEDRAETARYFLSALPDSLVQVCEQPSLACISHHAS